MTKINANDFGLPEQEEEQEGDVINILSGIINVKGLKELNSITEEDFMLIREQISSWHSRPSQTLMSEESLQDILDYQENYPPMKIEILD